MLRRAATLPETLARLRPLAKAAGVTRLAEVTWLDQIGLPVFQAVRPGSRSLSVHQGKGTTRKAAMVSALAEALEYHHCETLPPGAPAPDPGPMRETLWRRHAPAGQTRPLPDQWLPGLDLLTGRPMPVPHVFATLDCTDDRTAGWGAISTGVAIGNNLAEASLTGLCEVLEHAAHARFQAMSARERRACEFSPASVAERRSCWALARIRAAGCAVRLWDIGDDDTPPTIAAAILDGGTGPFLLLPSVGFACHPDQSQAIFAALAEAAQGRVTLIAGARDDIVAEDHVRSPAAAGDQVARFLLPLLSIFASDRPCPPPPPVAATHAEALLHILDGLARQGAPAVVRHDMTQGEDGIPAVRIFVPGWPDPDRAPA